MIPNLLKPLRRLWARTEATASTRTELATSVWRDTGNIFYLENTLKLTYQGKYGKITVENVHLDNLPVILADIAQQQSQFMQQADVAGQKDALYISVCAVTWQTDGQSTRIKAVPEAAILRSSTPRFERTQAVFKHEFMLEHDDLLSLTSTQKEGVFTYPNISLPQFVRQIELANAAVAPDYRRQLSVKQDNFATAFTEHETQVIEHLLAQR